jgi:hypothetical protein
MREAIRNRSAQALSEQAQKNAVRAVANQIITEISAIEKGMQIERRLSDPKNAAQRAEDFADTADAELTRISDGHLQFSPATKNFPKESGKELADFFDMGVAQLEPMTRYKPR